MWYSQRVRKNVKISLHKVKSRCIHLRTVRFGKNLLSIQKWSFQTRVKKVHILNINFGNVHLYQFICTKTSISLRFFWILNIYVQKVFLINLNFEELYLSISTKISILSNSCWILILSTFFYLQSFVSHSVVMIECGTRNVLCLLLVRQWLKN